VLNIQQLLFRALGILGVFLIASSKLGTRWRCSWQFFLRAFIGGRPC
jgi:hypothetical protein